MYCLGCSLSNAVGGRDGRRSAYDSSWGRGVTSQQDLYVFSFCFAPLIGMNVLIFCFV